MPAPMVRNRCRRTPVDVWANAPSRMSDAINLPSTSVQNHEINW